MTSPFRRLRLRVAAASCALLPALVGVAGAQSQSALLSQVSGTRAYRHVLELSQTIGPHVAGTPEDRTSGAYIAGQLARDGYSVEWQAFTFPYFDVRAVALTVPSSPSLVLHPRPMQYSPSTPAGGATADLVDAGLGRAADIRGHPLAGKIALVERGDLPFREKVENAAFAGAVAVVIYNNYAGEFGGTLVRPSRIPVVSLSGDEGQKLLALMRSGPVTVHLSVETTNQERTTWNIIGTKPGRERTVLVVGAHRDTVAAAPGANDNSSGVATALEMAEVLREVPLRSTVRFIFFGAEEEGLYGSAYYVRHPGIEPIIGMVNLDMEGVGERLEVANFRGSDALARTAARLAGQLGIRAIFAHEGASDHVNFESIGVPAVLLFRPDDSAYDTPGDTVSRVDPALIEISARLATAVVLEVAGTAP
jgi:aminopeptidase YwaD